MSLGYFIGMNMSIMDVIKRKRGSFREQVNERPLLDVIDLSSLEEDEEVSVALERPSVFVLLPSVISEHPSITLEL